MISLRKLLSQYNYEKIETENTITQDFVYDENRTEKFPIPKWWEKKEIHSRLPRGAVCKFTSSLNSAISNIKNGNIKKFEMKYRSKKIQRIIFILKINNTQR